jgi:hypothetical protein
MGLVFVVLRDRSGTGSSPASQLQGGLAVFPFDRFPDFVWLHVALQNQEMLMVKGKKVMGNSLSSMPCEIAF